MAKFSVDQELEKCISLGPSIKLVQQRLGWALKSLLRKEIKSLDPEKRIQASRWLSQTLDTLARLDQLVKGKPDSREEHVLPEDVIKALRAYLKGNGKNGES